MTPSAEARFGKAGRVDEWITDRSLMSRLAAVTFARKLLCLSTAGSTLNITS